MATLSGAASPMVWLDEWIVTAKQAPERSPSDFSLPEVLAQVHVPALLQLSADNVVRRRLKKAESTLALASNEATARHAVCAFLVDACWICAHANAERLAPSADVPRSEVIRDLEALTSTTEKLIEQLRKLAPDIGLATSMKYLGKRLAAGNPLLFTTHRKGWPRQLIEREQEGSIDQYLAGLAADIREEVALRRIAIETQRQRGGSASHLHAVIDMIGTATMRLSGSSPRKPDAELTAAAINILLQPTTPLATDTVRKRQLTTLARKTRPQISASCSRST